MTNERSKKYLESKGIDSNMRVLDSNNKIIKIASLFTEFSALEVEKFSTIGVPRDEKMYNILIACCAGNKALITHTLKPYGGDYSTKLRVAFFAVMKKHFSHIVDFRVANFLGKSHSMSVLYKKKMLEKHYLESVETFENNFNEYYKHEETNTNNLDSNVSA